jgi:hypothetical protein
MLAGLHDAFDALVRAGDDSLRKAYAFGQIVDALQGIGYTLGQMAAEINRTAPTVGKYAELYRRYPNVEALLRRAHQWSTADISILVRDDDALHTKFGYQCGTCGSWDTHRKATPERVAPGAVPSARFQS